MFGLLILSFFSLSLSLSLCLEWLDTALASLYVLFLLQIARPSPSGSTIRTKSLRNLGWKPCTRMLEGSESGSMSILSRSLSRFVGVAVGMTRFLWTNRVGVVRNGALSTMRLFPLLLFDTLRLWQKVVTVSDWSQAFADPEKPLFIDLGSGSGRFLLLKAVQNPEYNFLGIEIREKVNMGALF